jgi:hypothetical protein
MNEELYISCTRIRPTQTLNDTNRSIKTYTDETSILGYLGRQKDIHKQVAGQWTVISVYNFLCNDFELEYGDIIIYNEKTYEVVSDPHNTANLDDHIKVYIQKIANIKQQ